MKRRKFISRTLYAGGGMFVSSLMSFSEYHIGSSGQNKKLGVALVGLGSYSSGQLAPALRETQHCYLAGIVTGTPSKENVWAGKYNIPGKNIYNYHNFDKIAGNKDIDIVYVVLPNNMHAEYTIRAAEAGKHVICEKPMAISSEECRNMIAACNKAGKKLSIGYRLHFDPYHLKMMELGQHKVYGKLNDITGGHAFVLRDPNAWRLDKKMAGGGPLMDLGIYSVQSSIYISGELPVQISARNTTKDRDFFKDIEGSLEWEMQFPSGLRVHRKTSYEERYNYIKVEAEKGIFELNPAYSYGGLKGKTPDGPLQFPEVNQQALQMDAFALAVKQDKQSIVPGEMGLRDLTIMEKIYEAADTGKSVTLKDLTRILHKV